MPFNSVQTISSELPANQEGLLHQVFEVVEYSPKDSLSSRKMKHQRKYSGAATWQINNSAAGSTAKQMKNDGEGIDLSFISIDSSLKGVKNSAFL